LSRNYEDDNSEPPFVAPSCSIPMNLLLKSATLGLLPAFLALLLIAPDNLAQGTTEFLVVGPRTTEGNVSTDYPFRSDEGRAQQFYPSTAFSSSLTPVIEILSVAFRVNGDNSALSSLNETFNTLTLILSSTSKPVEQMTSSYAENTGADAVVVFDGSITFAAGPSPGPAPFNVRIPLQKRFIYDSSKGNLILEISHDRQTPGRGSLDAEAGGWFSLYGTTRSELGGIAPSLLITEFGYQAVPEPTTTTLLICGALIFFRYSKRRC
jgi:hypothetical protein